MLHVHGVTAKVLLIILTMQSYKFYLDLTLLTSSHRMPYVHAQSLPIDDRRTFKHAFRFLRVWPGDLSTCVCIQTRDFNNTGTIVPSCGFILCTKPMRTSLRKNYVQTMGEQWEVPDWRFCVTYKVWTWEQKMSTQCRNLKHCVDLHTSTQCFMN